MCFRPLMGIILFNQNAVVHVCVTAWTISFRPLMGIILFNTPLIRLTVVLNVYGGFRPLMGIILFNSIIEVNNEELHKIRFPSPNGNYFI